jgi:hypothetical protein
VTGAPALEHEHAQAAPGGAPRDRQADHAATDDNDICWDWLLGQ